MSVDNITREEFKLYRQVEKKEKLINTIRSSFGLEYALTTFSGFAATVGGTATAIAAYVDRPVLAIVNGVLTLANVGFAVYRGRKIANKYKQIGRVKEELEQIKENPTYKKLDSIK
jgi:hypothetical protein